MSDLRVWTLCEHGSRVRHWWFENEDDEDDETYVSCPGGKEMVLREYDGSGYLGGSTLYVVVDE